MIMVNLALVPLSVAVSALVVVLALMAFEKLAQRMGWRVERWDV